MDRGNVICTKYGFFKTIYIRFSTNTSVGQTDVSRNLHPRLGSLVCSARVSAMCVVLECKVASRFHTAVTDFRYRYRTVRG